MSIIEGKLPHITFNFKKLNSFAFKIEKQTRERLLAAVKKDVKQLMEEAVTKKFVHEDSYSVIILCSTIETCLLHGLKRRSVGLFKSGTTFALLNKISKECEPAEKVVKLCNEYEEDLANASNSNNNFFQFSK